MTDALVNLYRCVGCFTVYGLERTEERPESWYCHCGYRIDAYPKPLTFEIPSGARPSAGDP